MDEVVRATNCSFDLSPADILADLNLGWVVAEDSLLQDLRFPVAEVPNPQEGDRVAGGSREESDE